MTFVEGPSAAFIIAFADAGDRAPLAPASFWTPLMPSPLPSPALGSLIDNGVAAHVFPGYRKGFVDCEVLLLSGGRLPRTIADQSEDAEHEDAARRARAAAISPEWANGATVLIRWLEPCTLCECLDPSTLTPLHVIVERAGKQELQQWLARSSGNDGPRLRRTQYIAIPALLPPSPPAVICQRNSVRSLAPLTPEDFQSGPCAAARIDNIQEALHALSQFLEAKRLLHLLEGAMVGPPGNFRICLVTDIRMPEHTQEEMPVTAHGDIIGPRHLVSLVCRVFELFASLLPRQLLLFRAEYCES